MSDFDPKKKLILSILEFLEKERLQLKDADVAESLIVANELLSRAFGVSSAASASVPAGTAGLLEIYCLGLANYQQIAAAVAEARGVAVPSTASSASTTTTNATTSATSSTSTTDAASTTTTAASPTIDRPFDDAALEANFQKYVSMLTQQGYFKGVASGTAEYVTRIVKAREKFRARYVSESSSSSASTTASAATTTPNTTSSNNNTTSGGAWRPPTTLPSASDIEQAEKHKANGNSQLSAKKYDAAIVEYDAAIKFNPTSAVYYANK